MGTSCLSWAHLPLHGHIFPFMGTSYLSWAHLPFHGHIFLFIGTSSPSWAHLVFHGHIFPFMGTSFLSWGHLRFHGHIFPFMGTSYLSWAHLPFHGNIFPFMGASSPSFCFHHSSPANLYSFGQTEREAKPKAKAKPNMMTMCFCKPFLAHAMPRRLSNHILYFPVHSSQKLGLPPCLKKALGQKTAHTRCKYLRKYLACRNCWPNGPDERLTKYIKILYYKAT